MNEEVSDIIVNIAQYIEVEDWDDVFEMLLDINQKSFVSGFEFGNYFARWNNEHNNKIGRFTSGLRF